MEAAEAAHSQLQEGFCCVPPQNQKHETGKPFPFLTATLKPGLKFQIPKVITKRTTEKRGILWKFEAL